MGQKNFQVMYKNSLRDKMYNRIMLNGNKRTSEKLLFKTIKLTQKISLKKRGEDIVKTSLINSSPTIYIRKIQRKRKKTVEFPFLLKPKLKISYGIKNLIKFENKGLVKSFYKNFNSNLLNSCNKVGSNFNYKKQLHKEAFIKKKFANFRWF